jgi:hypothetical protein
LEQFGPIRAYPEDLGCFEFARQYAIREVGAFVRDGIQSLNSAPVRFAGDGFGGGGRVFLFWCAHTLWGDHNFPGSWVAYFVLRLRRLAPFPVRFSLYASRLPSSLGRWRSRVAIHVAML